MKDLIQDYINSTLPNLNGRKIETIVQVNHGVQVKVGSSYFISYIDLLAFIYNQSLTQKV